MVLLAAAQVLSRREDEYATEPLSKVTAEVTDVAGQEVSGSSLDRREQNRRVLLGKLHAGWKRTAEHLRDDSHGVHETREPFPLLYLAEVPSGLLEGIRRREQRKVRKLPQSMKPGSGLICGRKKNVGVEEDRVQGYRRDRGFRCGITSGSSPMRRTSLAARS